MEDIKAQIHGDATDDQIKAIDHIGNHARLLAGPETGTMHQAKGLTFDICFIVGAEDEFIQGHNTGEKEGDERRLLYVSMIRAKHKLFISYCNKRTGQQRHLGRNSGRERRTLTIFLKDSQIPIKQI